MVNIDKLERKIVDSNFSIGEVGSIINVDRSTLNRKMNNFGEGFTIKEAVSISKALKLTHNEINNIFFSHYEPHQVSNSAAIPTSIKPERITVKRASELTGLSQLSIRLGMQCGELPFGAVIKVSPKRTIYHISPGKLAEYLGITVEKVKER